MSTHSRIPALRNAGLAIAGGLLLAGASSPLLARADSYYPVEPEPITYIVAPSATDECGTESDGWEIPTGVPFVYYEQDELVWGDERVDGVGSVTIVASAQEGYSFPEGLETSWTFYFTDEACVLPEPEPTETPTETPAPTETPGALIPPSYVDAPPADNAGHLATTGGEFNWPALFLGGLAVLFGSALSYTSWKRASK